MNVLHRLSVDTEARLADRDGQSGLMLTSVRPLFVKMALICNSRLEVGLGLGYSYG